VCLNIICIVGPPKIKKKQEVMKYRSLFYSGINMKLIGTTVEETSTVRVVRIEYQGGWGNIQ